ncbi:hypothetical protein N8T08_001180 [Aspergillus melleus]|uniref:Uncharacterized protein n=1 Tax=Aspergillus melleus TaxID=138277 RepID=A0ACC3ANR6_9EURO|nr:hypothetical protein N8T08_001180 [Aspergillus melleus]
MTIGLSFRLLEVQCVKLDRKPITLVALSEFSGAGYNSKDVDANPALTIAGVHGLGRPYPAGTTGEHAFQLFSAAVKRREIGGIVAGTVDLFSSDLRCEVASVANLVPYCSSAACHDYKLSLALSTPTCTEYRVAPLKNLPVSAEEYHVEVVTASCTDTVDELEVPGLIFIAAHWNHNTPKVSSIVCKPSYSISQAHVSLHQRNSSAYLVIPFRVNNRISEQHIPGVAPTDLAAGFLSTLKHAETPLSKLPEVGNMMGNNSNSDGVHYSAFHLVAYISSLQSPQDLFNPSLLEKVSRQVYTSITAQIAKQYLLRSAEKEFEGESFGKISRVMSFLRLFWLEDQQETVHPDKELQPDG